MTHPLPPANLEPFVTALGVEDAVRFLLAFGGAELVYFRSPRQSKLVEVMGREAAIALAEADARHGLPRRVPLGKVWLAQVLRSRGLSVADIARRMHASDVSVRSWLKRQPRQKPVDPRQPSLF